MQVPTALVCLSVAMLATITQGAASNAQDAQGGRKLMQYPTYGKSLGGPADDNTVGWGNADAQGYAALHPNCTAPLTNCHARGECINLMDNVLYCGSCDNTCDFFTQICSTGKCVCKNGFSACATKGGRCLDAASCPPGNGTFSDNLPLIDINTDSVQAPIG